MAKKANPTPSRTCADCFHFSACHLWAVSISTDVAPQCPQFEPARYASIADLHEMHQMAKGELVPVVHGRVVWKNRFMGGFVPDVTITDKAGEKHTGTLDTTHYEPVPYCSECGKELGVSSLAYCPNCGAKMDLKEEG